MVTSNRQDSLRLPCRRYARSQFFKPVENHPSLRRRRSSAGCSIRNHRNELPWIAFASARGGFKDEMPVGEGGGQGARDIFVMRLDGTTFAG